MPPVHPAPLDEARELARHWEDDCGNSVAQARELRRALDVLEAQPGVDPRPRAYVPIAGVPRSRTGTRSARPAGRPRARRLRRSATGSPGSTRCGRARPCSSSAARRTATRRATTSWSRAAPEPRRIATYRSGHAMDAPIIRLDRTAWLAEQLSLPER
ncbi:MAG: hypothetical protein AB1941_23630 [Gemmatimonadota bacterium]